MERLKQNLVDLPQLKLVQASIAESSGRAANKEMSPSETSVAGETDCLGFADFAAIHRIEGFDVLLIDAAASGAKVLSQIDLLRFAPKCVQLAILHLPPAETAQAISQLRNAGYACYAQDDGRDLLAIRQDFCLAHFHML